MGFLSTPEFWVAVSFFIFLGALFYFGVHKKVARCSMRARRRSPRSWKRRAA